MWCVAEIVLSAFYFANYHTHTIPPPHTTHTHTHTTLLDYYLDFDMVDLYDEDFTIIQNLSDTTWDKLAFTVYAYAYVHGSCIVFLYFLSGVSLVLYHVCHFVWSLASLVV